MSKYNLKHNSLIGIAFLSLILLMKNTERAQAQDQFDKLQYPYEMYVANLEDDLTIAYADEGSKNQEVILFIHGLGSYAPAWKYNIPKLSKSYRCIIVDLVGYGKSSKGNYQADMSFHANNIFSLMQTIAIPAFHIVGHSMGGQIAIHMALKEPKRVKSLSLIAPAGIETFNEQEKQLLINSSTSAAIAAVSDEQYKINLSVNFYKMDERADFMYNDRVLIKNDSLFKEYCHVVSQGIKGMLNEPVFDRLPQLNTPTLIIYGNQDRLIPNSYLHAGFTTKKIGISAQENIPNSTLKMVDKAGHFANFDQPDKVNELILNFLNN
jgi:pimeloyl-ACP methyl ester carboxylesterase